MLTDLIILKEYCSRSQIDPEFLFTLEEAGLIEIHRFDEDYYLHSSQLSDLERYARWHYELSVNAEGIDIIQNLTNEIRDMQEEIARLKGIIKLTHFRQ